MLDFGTIANFLQRELSTPWADILKACETDDENLSELDRALGHLVSLQWSEHSYRSSSLGPPASPDSQSVPQEFPDELQSKY